MSKEITYQRFYSASDTQIVISNLESTELLTLDLATGVGLTESAPMEPVYGIGSQIPSFFITKNSMVSGFIGIAYKHDSYLQRSIQYVNGIKKEKDIQTEEEESYGSFEKLRVAIEKRDSGELSGSRSSLVSNHTPFNLTLIFSTGNVNEEFQSITIYSCYLVGRSMMIGTDGENPVSEGFSFIASNIK